MRTIQPYALGLMLMTATPAMAQLYSLSGPPTGGGSDVFRSILISRKSLGGGRFEIKDRLVMPGSVRSRTVQVDCHRSSVTDRDRGRVALEISPDPHYRPPLSLWDDENLWWAVCHGQYRRYGGHLKGAVQD